MLLVNQEMILSLLNPSYTIIFKLPFFFKSLRYDLKPYNLLNLFSFIRKYYVDKNLKYTRS